MTTLNWQELACMHQALKQNYQQLFNIPYVWFCVAGNYSSDEAALDVFASSEGNGVSSQPNVCPQRSCCKKLHVRYICIVHVRVIYSPSYTCNFVACNMLHGISRLMYDKKSRGFLWHMQHVARNREPFYSMR